MKALVWKILPKKRRWLWAISMLTSKISNRYSRSTRAKSCYMMMKIRRIRKTPCLSKKKNLKPNPQTPKWLRRRKNMKHRARQNKFWPNSLRNWPLLLPCQRKKNSLRREKLIRCSNQNSSHHHHPHLMRRNPHMEDTYKTRAFSTFSQMNLMRKKRRIKKLT